MKTLLDFFPILIFFGTYKFYDIYTATGVLMLATLVQMGLIYAIDKRLQAIHKVTLFMVLAFGALTLALHDERFIKWKPTVLYCAFAFGLAYAQWGLRKNVVQTLLGSQIDLPNGVWLRLQLAWIGYSAFMAALNALVVVFFSTDQWMNFKLWGFALPVAFLVAQGFYIAPYLRSEDDKPSKDPAP
ncbi:MAG: septation protein A [Rhodoferax sp.]